MRFSFESVVLASFIDIIHRANLEPEKKYREPQTTSQEIGWFHEPLVIVQVLIDKIDCLFIFI